MTENKTRHLDLCEFCVTCHQWDVLRCNFPCCWIAQRLSTATDIRHKIKLIWIHHWLKHLAARNLGASWEVSRYFIDFTTATSINETQKTINSKMSSIPEWLIYITQESKRMACQQLAACTSKNIDYKISSRTIWEYRFPKIDKPLFVTLYYETSEKLPPPPPPKRNMQLKFLM
jgi:hypothetical protein